MTERAAARSYGKGWALFLGAVLVLAPLLLLGAVLLPRGTGPSAAPPGCGSAEGCEGFAPAASALPVPAATLTVSVTAVPLAGPPVLQVTLTAHARGGSVAGPYNFTWSFGDGSPPTTSSVAATPPETNDTVSHGYGHLGNYTVLVTVNDSGAVASSSVVIRVTSQLLVTVVAIPAVITLGEAALLTANASGGASPYTYSWTGVPPGCLVRGASLTCSPQLPGNYSITAQVVDSIGETATWTFHLLVNPPITVTARALAHYVCNAGAGTATFNLSGGAQGGTPPYVFYWDPGDGTPRVTGQLVSHTYPLGGNYNATLTVYDSTGANASGVARLTTSLPGCSATTTVPFFGPPQYLVLGISAVVVVVLALLYWDWRRRPSSPATSPPPEAAPEAAPPPPAVAAAPVPPPGASLDTAPRPPVGPEPAAPPPADPANPAAGDAPPGPAPP